MYKKALSIVLLAGLLLATSGCKSKNDEMIDPGYDTGSTGMENTRGDGLPQVDLDRLTFTADPSLRTVYFDYDSSALRADALSALSYNAEQMKQNPGYIYQVQGHCDERGTQEYNLALGERRALSVRSHLISLGVSGDRLVTISYGEEAPAEYGSTESAYAKNRRAEFGRAMAR